MIQLSTGPKKIRGLTRRQLMTVGMTGLAGLFLSPIAIAPAALHDDVEQVSQIPQMAERESPLLIFRDYIADPDVEVEQHIRLQLGQRKDLLGMLKKKIAFEKKVELSVEDLQVRLMFVPQLEEEYAAAYQRYCIDITQYLFIMNAMESFYTTVTSPKKSFPAIANNGVSAFLVHRLAKAYRAVCRFTAESGRSVKFKAKGAIFSNHLGAVDLEIESLAPGEFGLKRKPFTIWQDDTENLYTLMSVPVEETLHFQLGRATDREIFLSIKKQPPVNLSSAQKLAEEWMAVEESVVGGLVNRVLARYCDENNLVLPSAFTEETNKPSVPSLNQYKYRSQGIRLVQNLGIQATMSMYMQSPSAYRERLFAQQGA
jgi:hypothetical protein